jgi:hypothetical protein
MDGPIRPAFHAFCLTVPRRTFTGLVRPQNHSPRSKPSDQTNGVPLRASLVEGVLGPGAPRLSQRVRARRPHVSPSGSAPGAQNRLRRPAFSVFS